MTIWNSSDSFLTGFVDPEGAAMIISQIGLTSGALTTIDWAPLTSISGGITTVSPYIFTVNGFRLRVYQGGSWDYDDQGQPQRHPASGTALLGRIYYTASDGVNNSPEYYKDISFSATATGDVAGPVPMSISPSHQSTNNPTIGAIVDVFFDEPIAVGTGIVKLKTRGGADIQSWTLPGAIGSGVTITGNKLTLSASVTLPSTADVAPYVAAGAVKDASNNNCAPLTDDSLFFTTAPQNPAEQPLPPPAYVLWDFDHTAVSFTTTTDCATWSAVVTAVGNALNDPGTVGSPKYHKVRYTGGPIVGSVTLAPTATAPAAGTVGVLVEPTTQYQTITGELHLGLKSSYVKFAGWCIQPDTPTYGAATRAFCVEFDVVSIRTSFYDCRMGLFWRSGFAGLDPQKPDAFGGTNIRDCQLKVVKCDLRDCFQTYAGRAGYAHFEDNLVSGLTDDFIFTQCRGLAPGISYVYAARNIIFDMADNPAYSGNHTDAFQMGGVADVITDIYHVEAHQNIYVGNNYRQYATHGLFLQTGGPARNWISKAWDNIWMVTGFRGIELSDKRADIQRQMCVWPPLAGATGDPNNIQTTGGLRTPELWLNFNTANGSTFTPTLKDIIADSVQDKAGWGVTVVNFKRADPAASSGPTSYMSFFPNLNAVWSPTSAYPQVRIWPAASGYEAAAAIGTRDALRAWVSYAYMPLGGWTANGFTDPATWKAAA